MTSLKWGVGSLIAALLLGVVGLGGLALLVLVLSAIAGTWMSISERIGRARARLKGDVSDQPPSRRTKPHER
jgi:hypothetical protein